MTTESPQFELGILICMWRVPSSAVCPTDINECDIPGSCDQNATCVNNFGSYNCSCLVGYSGDGLTCGGKFILALDRSLSAYSYLLMCARAACGLVMLHMHIYIYILHVGYICTYTYICYMLVTYVHTYLRMLHVSTYAIHVLHVAYVRTYVTCVYICSKLCYINIHVLNALHVHTCMHGRGVHLGLPHTMG